MGPYSLLNDRTGFSSAALIAWKLIVTIAMSNATIVVSTNTVQVIGVLYAKSCSHLFITSQATGEAIRMETVMSFRKSLESRVTIPGTLAPKTFLTPISFVRCSALNVASPNKPKQEIKIAISEIPNDTG